MPSVGSTTRPAFVYDQATDTWVPVGIGPHTHATTDIISLQAAIDNTNILNIMGAN